MNFLLRISLSAVMGVCHVGANAQIVVWSEDFDGNGGAGSNWGTLNSTIGVQGITPNVFYISDTESGLTAGSCGASGMGDNSLHVGSTTVGDVGAAYDASVLCLPGCLVCDFFPAFCSDVTTNVRSESASFSTVGLSGMTIAFNYMEFGDLANDNAQLWYNEGSGWTLWTDLAKTVCCGGGACTGFVQGQWTSFSLALPAVLENKANVQIGFGWQNNADGTGTDPSFAVDDIFITRISPLPVEWLGAEVLKYEDGAILKWSTASENGSDKFIIERSQDGDFYTEIGQVKAAGNSSSTKHYAFNDLELEEGNYLYRIKQLDFDGAFEYSKDLVLTIMEEDIKLRVYPNPANDRISIECGLSQPEDLQLQVYSVSGKLMKSEGLAGQKGSNHVQIDVSDLSPGVYFVTKRSQSGIHSTRLVIQ